MPHLETIKEPVKRPKRKPETTSVGGFMVELAKIVLIALAIIVPIRYFLVQPFYVKGASMEPTFYDHEYLLIDEITYRFSEPQRGDIVVLRYPRDPSQFFIKRIVGMPGERIEIKDSAITIYSAQYPNGVRLPEDYLDPATAMVGEVTATLEVDEYYVMGDNRSASLDSRSFGPINRKFLVGRTWLRVWPFSKFRQFEQPSYSVGGQ